MVNQVQENKTPTGMSFTLSQLLLVCICIGLFLSVYISRILRLSIEANEGAAIGSLRTASTSQEQFKNSTQVDQNNNGSGEFGLLSELAGTTSRRGGGSRANPTFITPILGPKGTNTYSVKSGYRFQVFLPGLKNNSPLTDNGIQEVKHLSCKKCLLPKLCTKCNKVIDAQETHYRLYAWPNRFNFTGIKCFAVDQSGEVVWASNEDLVSYGGDNSPAFDAAVNNGSGYSGNPDFDPTASKKLGNDGDTFVGIIDGKNIAKDGQKWVMQKY